MSKKSPTKKQYQKNIIKYVAQILACAFLLGIIFFSDRVHIRKSADVEGSIQHKTLSIQEGSVLKIKVEKKNN